MTSYRLKKSSPRNARRKSNNKKERKFFFIFSEGTKTEPIYFSALKEGGHIRRDIQLNIMERTDRYQGHSNQLGVIEDVAQYIEKINLIEDSSDIYDISKRILDGKNISYLDLYKYANFLKDLFDKDIFNKELRDKIDKREFIDAMKAIFNLSKYDPTYDEIWVVIDRDLESFKDYQFDNAIVLSKIYNFNLAITNPCFEFFLCLHLSDMKEYNIKKIKENPKYGNKTYVEKILDNLYMENGRRYKKSSYDTNILMKNLDKALDNLEYYETDIERIKNRVGSSIYGLLKEIIE